MTKNLYCALCWQEFDHPNEHNAGSWFKGERLDSPCKGDIRVKDSSYRPKVKREPSPELNLDAAEPINLK